MGQGAPPAATFARLDTLYGSVLAHVEAGFRGRADEIEVPPDVRDRLVGASPRRLFTLLARP
jgi:hypothetical protein